MKLRVKIEKEIKLPDLNISNINNLNEEFLEKILYEIKEQLSYYFDDDLSIRRIYREEICFCNFCNE